MTDFDAQEILNALPIEYHLIDMNTKKIIQSNNKKVTPGTACYKAVFNTNIPCKQGDPKCICELKLSENSQSKFIVEKDYDEGKKFFCVEGKLLRNNIALLNLTEITEHVQLEKEVKDNAIRMEGAEKLANFGYWEMDTKTSIIHPSYGSKVIYGIEQECITLAEARGFTLPEQRDVVKESFDKLINERIGFNIKYQIQRHSDKAIRYIQALADYREDKHIVYGIIHDITETIEARKSIDENAEYLKFLFRSMNSAFAQHKIITNEKGEPIDYVFLDVNPKFEEFTGLKKEDIINKTVREVLPNTESLWIKRYGEVAISGKPTEFTDYAVEFDKYYHVSAFSPKRNYFAVSFTDVTQRTKTLKALQDAKEKAVESDRLKTLFLANMSHEIRTPLNGILGFSNLLTESDVDNNQRKSFQKIIENSGKRLITVIDDIINISMIQSNQFRINYDQFDIVELLKELFFVYREQYEEELSNVDFQLQLCAECNVATVYSDKNRIYQVIKNLLDNALKFTSEGKIEFGLKKMDTDTISIYVKDTGVGIDESKQRLIFDVFRQAEEGQSRTYEGSGLGLAIVAGILEKLNGEITVSSSLGAGSAFDIIIPRNSEKIEVREHTENENDNSAISSSYTKRIVSFEDDSSSAVFMKTVVESIGCELINFELAEGGIDFIKNNEVDLIFMDVRLPEMNGYEATKIIKEQFPEIPIIIQTAFAMAGDREKAMQAGCDDYVTKPLTSNAIRQAICKFVKVEN